ncbi:MAG TPA: hypothetical protein DD633_03555 [Sphaerochaeta sp.]|nr:hypothetical protein [Sphaerochaeta sp.]
MYIRLTPASNRCIALLYLRKFKLQDLLRRTRGTDLYQQGIPMELVARHLGHSCLHTTRTYYAIIGNAQYCLNLCFVFRE